MLLWWSFQVISVMQWCTLLYIVCSACEWKRYENKLNGPETQTDPANGNDICKKEMKVGIWQSGSGYPSKFFWAIQSYCSCLSVGLLLHNSRPTLFQVDCRIFFERDECTHWPDRKYTYTLIDQSDQILLSHPVIIELICYRTTRAKRLINKSIMTGGLKNLRNRAIRPGFRNDSFKCSAHTDLFLWAKPNKLINALVYQSFCSRTIADWL